MEPNMIATASDVRAFVLHPSVDHDLRTALSLARASTAALLSLSALARREMITALTEEVALLQTFEDEPSLHAAGVLARYLPERVDQGGREESAEIGSPLQAPKCRR
jgi:hypothetical protein